MTRAGPRLTQQAQPDLPSMNSAERKRIKGLKRLVARARRIGREGLPATDVACPHCDAAPLRSRVRQGLWEYGCTTNGSHHQLTWNPLPGHASHRARREEAARRKAMILADGAEAARKLGLSTPS